MQSVFAHIFTGPLFGFKRRTHTGLDWNSVEGTHSKHLTASRELVKTALVCKTGHTQFQKYVQALISTETRYAWHEAIAIAIKMSDPGNFFYVPRLATAQFSLYFGDKFLHGTKIHLRSLNETYVPGSPDMFELAAQYNVDDGKAGWDESTPEYTTPIPQYLFQPASYPRNPVKALAAEQWYVRTREDLSLFLTQQHAEQSLRVVAN
jgi:hypothetical protein